MPAPAEDWAYFFDVDGTLVDIAETPEGVCVAPGLQRLIESLYGSTDGAVALISGRSIADIDRLFPGVRLPVAGQHGIERRDFSGRIHRRASAPAQLDRVRNRMAEAVARHPGLLLEDKGLSLALHYRRAPRLGSFVHRLLRLLAAQAGPEYCLQSGKFVVEIRPVGGDKGAAILAFMRDPNFRGRTPVFVGDDITDEDGFEVVNRLGGYTVKVGAGQSVARLRLPDVAAVRQWLEHAASRPQGKNCAVEQEDP